MNRRYENRLPPEGINVSPDHPLKEFAWLLLASALIIGAVIVVLAFCAELLAPRIPFRYEQALVTNTWPQSLAADTNHNATERQLQLQTLVQKLLQPQPLPEDLDLHIHYVDNPQVNALATLGGNIIVFSGLMDKLQEDDKTLAFVLAHEIGHIVHRDPMKAVGRGVILGLVLATLAGVSDNNIPDWVATQTGTLTALSFSRDQERAADIYALTLIKNSYGNVDGVEALFTQLREARQGESWEWLSSHPLYAERIEKIKAEQSH